MNISNFKVCENHDFYFVVPFLTCLFSKSYKNFKILLFSAEMMRQAGLGGKITSPKDRKFYGD